MVWRSPTAGFIMVLLLCGGTAAAGSPRPAPRIYVTPNYALTFRAPARSTYCPLAPDWVGSDHGTTIFLSPPAACGTSNGYASSGRVYTPETTPRIDVYYGYWTEEAPPERCDSPAGRVRFLGRSRFVCQTRSGGLIADKVYGRYEADSPAEAYLTLVTTKDRYKQDFAAFVAMAGSLRPCRVRQRMDGKTVSFGVGARCPARETWY